MLLHSTCEYCYNEISTIWTIYSNIPMVEPSSTWLTVAMVELVYMRERKGKHQAVIGCKHPSDQIITWHKRHIGIHFIAFNCS